MNGTYASYKIFENVPYPMYASCFNVTCLDENLNPHPNLKHPNSFIPVQHVPSWKVLQVHSLAISRIYLNGVTATADDMDAIFKQLFVQLRTLPFVTSLPLASVQILTPGEQNNLSYCSNTKPHMKAYHFLLLYHILNS